MASTPLQCMLTVAFNLAHQQRLQPGGKHSKLDLLQQQRPAQPYCHLHLFQHCWVLAADCHQTLTSLTSANPPVVEASHDEQLPLQGMSAAPLQELRIY